MNEITLEQVNEFYKYLQGEIPKVFVGVKSPKLKPRMAFHVIYVLQELLRVIPDHYECCCRCNELFDMHSEGGFTNGSFCGFCIKTKKFRRIR